MVVMDSLAKLVLHAAVDAGGIRALSRRTGIGASYLSRLSRGAMLNPSDDVLKALGITRVVSYRKEAGNA